MPPRPNIKKPNSNNNTSKKRPAAKQKPTNTPKPANQTNSATQPSLLDNSAISLPLQQLLLNVFHRTLFPNAPSDTAADEPQSQPESDLDLKPLIQTIKSHLYNRDFDSAFADADESLLRAYALRWSPTRALGYAGVFKAVLGLMDASLGRLGGEGSGNETGQIVCVGGGAGAEIVALAGAWRDLLSSSTTTPGEGDGDDKGEVKEKEGRLRGLTVTAVDIADWSRVVDRLNAGIWRSNIPSLKNCRAPLLPSSPRPAMENSDDDKSNGNGDFKVTFQRTDVLSLNDASLHNLYNNNSKTVMVTLMFTLNELFSTSIAKATSFLLRTTDAVQPGTILLVVDSPGSYSSLTLGGGGGERRYPMKFLLDHTLLSVAEGKWERVVSQDSRWWRRDASRLVYDVGEGAGLEDMRYQVHIYRRLA